jgi:signal transduction histidine kinase
MGVEYLKANFKLQDEDAAGCLDDIENAVVRADTVIKGLLDFSSISKLEVTVQEINSLIDKSLLLVKHVREKNNVRVTRDFGKDIPAVSIDGNRIEQVFVNLFMNAIQAMPSGGELRIRTFRVGSSDKRQGVVVQIEDTGTGMPESVLKDLFVPFTTTKRSAGGTGLGLSIVKNIMEMHGGRITLENKTGGHGVRATLWFKTGGWA